MSKGKKRTGIIVICLAAVVAVGVGYFIKTNSNSKFSLSNITVVKKNPNSSNKVPKEKAFDLYSKVKIGTTKDEVDSLLNVKPVEEPNASVVGQAFNYKDANTGFGVTVVYNKDNKAFSKTLICNSISDTAHFCTKSFNKRQASKITGVMSHKDVIKLLGEDGVERCNLADDTDLSTVANIYCWVNKGGSYIEVVFDDQDKVETAMFINK
ncbi:MAG: hypothetical protein Q8900_13180 [Bacillota bacterium]|nr:hypothetical protein [Bacillota bacterium]